MIEDIASRQVAVVELFLQHRAERPKFHFFAGTSPWNSSFSVEIGIGFRKNAPLGEIRWRHYWMVSINPWRLIWQRNRIIGYKAFGRGRIFR